MPICFAIASVVHIILNQWLTKAGLNMTGKFISKHHLEQNCSESWSMTLLITHAEYRLPLAGSPFLSISPLYHTLTSDLDEDTLCAIEMGNKHSYIVCSHSEWGVLPCLQIYEPNYIMLCTDAGKSNGFVLVQVFTNFTTIIYYFYTLEVCIWSIV